MRTIKSNFFISLDGVVESPERCHFPYFEDEIGGRGGRRRRHRRRDPDAPRRLRRVGRVLAEHADEPFGDVMNSMKKYVVSNSLQAAQWQNTEVVSGDVAQKLGDINDEHEA